MLPPTLQPMSHCVQQLFSDWINIPRSGVQGCISLQLKWICSIAVQSIYIGWVFLMLVLRLSLSMNSHNVEYLESQSVDQTRAVSHFFSERLTKPSIRMTMFVFLILKSSSQRRVFNSLSSPPRWDLLLNDNFLASITNDLTLPFLHLASFFCAPQRPDESHPHLPKTFPTRPAAAISASSKLLRKPLFIF